MPKVYIAGPYSHESAMIRESRFYSLTQVAAHLWERRITCYSPITEGHTVVTVGGRDIPTDWEFWKQHDTEMIAHCKVFLRVLLYGHEKSVGLAAETEIARSLGLPIVEHSICDPIEQLVADINAALEGGK